MLKYYVNMYIHSQIVNIGLGTGDIVQTSFPTTDSTPGLRGTDFQNPENITWSWGQGGANNIVD